MYNSDAVGGWFGKLCVRSDKDPSTIDKGIGIKEKARYGRRTVGELDEPVR